MEDGVCQLVGQCLDLLLRLVANLDADACIRVIAVAVDAVLEVVFLGGETERVGDRDQLSVEAIGVVAFQLVDWHRG